MYELAQETDKSLTDLVLGFLDDAHTWWGLSEELAADLRKDADRLNLSQRDYILYLLTERCAALREHGTGWEKDKLAVLLSKRR